MVTTFAATRLTGMLRKVSGPGARWILQGRVRRASVYGRFASLATRRSCTCGDCRAVGCDPDCPHPGCA